MSEQRGRLARLIKWARNNDRMWRESEAKLRSTITELLRMIQRNDLDDEELKRLKEIEDKYDVNQR